MHPLARCRVAVSRDNSPHARRTAMASLLVLALASPLAADDAGSGPRDGRDWPSFLGPQRNATSPETGIRTSWPAGGPPLVWQLPMGEGYANVSIADGRAFAFDRQGDEARLTAVDARSGARLWQKTYATAYEDMYGYSGGPRAVPVIDGERVYSFGAEGRLRAHATSDGAVLWDIDTTARYGVQQNFFGAGSAPLMFGDLLLVAVGGSPKDSPGIKSGAATSNGTAIVAFDKLNGTERYRVGDDLASYASPLVASIGGRQLGLHFARGGLLGFDPVRGEALFHFPWRAKLLESVNAATPVVVGDRVFLTEVYGPGSVLLRIAGKKPEVVWRDAPRDHRLTSHWTTPVHHRGILYGCAGRGAGDGELRAIDLGSGKVRWQEKAPGRSTLLLVDGHLVVLGEYGELWLIEATPERFHKVASATPTGKDGKKLLEHPAWNAPVLAHGLLYLRGKNRLIALELIPPG